ncbi:hypothetical protein D3C71_2056500 [compost metagenome]
MEILPAADPHIIGNFRNRNLALSQQHPGLVHAQPVQIVRQRLTCMSPEDPVQISRMNIHCVGNLLNLYAPVIVLVQELHCTPYI